MEARNPSSNRPLAPSSRFPPQTQQRSACDPPLPLWARIHGGPPGSLASAPAPAEGGPHSPSSLLPGPRGRCFLLPGPQAQARTLVRPTSKPGGGRRAGPTPGGRNSPKRVPPPLNRNRLGPARITSMPARPSPSARTRQPAAPCCRLAADDPTACASIPGKQSESFRPSDANFRPEAASPARRPAGKVACRRCPFEPGPTQRCSIPLPAQCVPLCTGLPQLSSWPRPTRRCCSNGLGGRPS